MDPTNEKGCKEENKVVEETQQSSKNRKWRGAYEPWETEIEVFQKKARNERQSFFKINQPKRTEFVENDFIVSWHGDTI